VWDAKDSTLANDVWHPKVILLQHYSLLMRILSELVITHANGNVLYEKNGHWTWHNIFLHQITVNIEQWALIKHCLFTSSWIRQYWQTTNNIWTKWEIRSQNSMFTNKPSKISVTAILMSSFDMIAYHSEYITVSPYCSWTTKTVRHNKIVDPLYILHENMQFLDL
jgi:hypothetical protein